MWFAPIEVIWFVLFNRLGSSEVEQVQCVIDGVNLLIKMEKRLEAGMNIISYF